MNMNSPSFRKSGIALILFSLISISLSAQTAEEILEQVESNEIFSSSKIIGTLSISDRFGERESSFQSWSLGDDYSLLEFTSIEEEGQKILKVPSAMYLYFPDAEDLIKLQGAALRDSLLDSDLSYEDMLGDDALLENYNATLLGEENLDGVAYFKIELLAKERNVAYPKEILWIEKDRYVTKRIERYSLSGRLLKELEMREYLEQDGQLFPVVISVKDSLKRNSETIFTIDSIELNISIDASFFSLDEVMF
jgi:outer membrane lipoprotein-sorting protein